MFVLTPDSDPASSVPIPQPIASGMLIWGTRGPPSGSLCAKAAELHTGQWIRNAINWDSCDPGRDGNGPFNWGELDSKIGACRASKTKMLVMLNSGSGYPSGASIDSYARFCGEIAKRYNFPELGGVEFGNEPNNQPGANVANVAVAASNAIAAVQVNKPKNLRFYTLAGGFSGEAGLYVPTQQIKDFYAALKGRSDNLDLVSFHPYHRPNPPELTDGVNGRPPINQQLTRLMLAATQGGWTRNFAVTEFGWPTAGLPNVRGKATERMQAMGQVRESVMLLSTNRVKIIIQFQLMGYSTPSIEEGGLGMIRCASDVADDGSTPGAGTYKPAFKAWQVMCNVLDEGFVSMTKIAEPDPASPDPWQYRYNKTNGRWGYVFWTVPNNSSTSLKLTNLGDSVRKTMMNGSQAVANTTQGILTVSATNEPTYIDVVW